MTKEDLQAILLHPTDHEWSLQGLGMLRTYLDPERTMRLHVWSNDAKFQDVSELHTHPWDMTSTVIVGELKQERYVPSLGDEATHMCQKILCGEGGGLCDVPRTVGLRMMLPEFYYGLGEGGESEYHQLWWEIHRSVPADGTCTLVEREFTADPDHAYVFWPVGEEWVSAEPRPATEEEVFAITGKALDLWF